MGVFVGSELGCQRCGFGSLIFMISHPLRIIQKIILAEAKTRTHREWIPLESLTAFLAQKGFCVESPHLLSLLPANVELDAGKTCFRLVEKKQTVTPAPGLSEETTKGSDSNQPTRANSCPRSKGFPRSERTVYIRPIHHSVTEDILFEVTL